MILKGIAGFLLFSAVAVPGTIYIAKPELFNSGKTQNETPPGNTSVNNASNTPQKPNSGESSETSTITKPSSGDGNQNPAESRTSDDSATRGAEQNSQTLASTDQSPQEQTPPETGTGASSSGKQQSK